ncbi:MAG: STAS domain-containing protein [Pseudomonadota bacterium]
MREVQPGKFALKGDLDFTSVNRVLSKTEALFEKNSDITLDFNDVNRTDSAGLALLVEWVRNARKQKRKITFENLPPQMISIAKMSGLDAMLPVKPRNTLSDSTH